MPNETIEVHADYKNIRIPCERLRALLKSSDVPEETIDLCELALQELLTNLVDHAYAGNANGHITVNLSRNPSQIVMETRDTGIPPQMDLSQTSMPAPEELVEGGYGMAIIQTLMDEARYFTSQGTNTWRLVKNLK